jgi:hypothetical protein
VRTEARPVSELTPRSETTVPVSTPQAAPAAPERAAEAERVGRVVEQRATVVVIDLGTQHGLAVGSRVAFFAQREQQLVAGEKAAVVEDLVAVGAVTAVSEGHAEVRLGIGESVSDGAAARPTEQEITASRWLPPRTGGLWSVAFTARPFLAIGALGFGTLSDLIVGYRFATSARLQLVLEPLAVGIADDGNVFSSAGNLIGSYDRELFEIGLGAGWSAVNEGARAYGLSIAQLARLGAEDGVYLTVRNTFILYDEEFRYGGTLGTLMVPIGERSWLFGRGGGGQAGYNYGELGLRLLVTGRGLNDSLFLSASLGGGGVFGNIAARAQRCVADPVQFTVDARGDCFRRVDYAGPLVGLGVEWRP